MAFLSATVQFKPVWGKPQLNRLRIRKILQNCVREKMRLVVLPEMCISGYIFRNAAEIEPFCENADGISYAAIADFCQQYGIYVVYGFAERDGETLYNAQNLVGPEGKLLATYRKTHLYESDRSWAMAGDTGFQCVDTEIGRLGLGICMDLNFDDFADYHIAQKTDVICFSACWLDEGFPVAPYWLDRLWGYTGTTLMANSFGEERGTKFRGESAVISCGALMARAGVDGEAVIVMQHGGVNSPRL